MSIFDDAWEFVSDGVDAVVEAFEDAAEEVGEFVLDEIVGGVIGHFTGGEGGEPDDTDVERAGDELRVADLADNAYGTIDDVVTVPDAWSAALAQIRPEAGNEDDWTLERSPSDPHAVSLDEARLEAGSPVFPANDWTDFSAADPFAGLIDASWYEAFSDRFAADPEPIYADHATPLGDASADLWSVTFDAAPAPSSWDYATTLADASPFLLGNYLS